MIHRGTPYSAYVSINEDALVTMMDRLDIRSPTAESPTVPSSQRLAVRASVPPVMAMATEATALETERKKTTLSASGGRVLTALYEPTGQSRMGVKSSSVANTRARSMNDSVNVRATA